MNSPGLVCKVTGGAGLGSLAGLDTVSVFDVYHYVTEHDNNHHHRQY